MPYVTAPKTERQKMFNWRGVLKEHDGLRAFAQYLLHAGFRADNGGYLADFETVFRQFGLKLYRSGERARARTLLWLYRLFADKDLNWSKPHSNERARTVTNHGIPKEILSLRDAFLETPERFEEVFFMTGTKPTRTAKSRLRGEIEEESPVIDPPQPAEDAKSYLNGRSGSLFTSIQNNVSSVRGRINRGEFGFGPDKTRLALQKLSDIETWPKPTYRHSLNSPRLRAVGENQLASLDGTIRKALYAGNHVELDLSKAHASVAARDWGGLELLNEWLRKQRDGTIDFWKALSTTILTGTPLSDKKAARKAVKKGFYTIVYGGKRSTVVFEMANTYESETGSRPDNSQIEGFLGHPMVKELLSARDAKLEKIRSQEGMGDCFGRPVAMEDFPHRDNPARTVLAYCSQASELFLLQPIFDLAIEEDKAVGRGEKQRREFQVLLYQFDGVTIQVARKEQWKRIAKKLKDAVDRRARDEGYVTTLDVDWAPSQ